MKNKIIILFVVITTFNVKAQEGDAKKDYGSIITDRPDQTESPTVVPKSFLQIETGFFYETVETESGSLKVKNKSTALNTTLLRYGLLDNLELRVGFDFTEQSRELNGNKLNNIASGFSPLLLGAKIGVTKEKGLLPEIGFLGHINLPFLASNDYKPENTGVDFRFSFAHTLSEKSSLAYNLGMAWGDDSPEASYIYTLVYGYSITNNLGTYIEVYGDFPENSNASKHRWDAGLTYLIKDNIQLDVFGGTGITQNIQDLILSAGISIRIPTKK